MKDDLRAELAQAQKRVTELYAEIDRQRIEALRERLHAQRGEPGGILFLRIGEAIRAARQGAGLTQAQVGGAVGVLRTSIVNIEKGRQRLPIDLLYDIADVLGVEATSLLPRNQDV